MREKVLLSRIKPLPFKQKVKPLPENDVNKSVFDKPNADVLYCKHCF